MLTYPSWSGGSMSSIGTRANAMELCTEKIRSCSRSPRSLPSKIHAATPPQNLAAVESLLRATRAPSSSSMALLSENIGSEDRFLHVVVCGISNKNKMDRSFLYLCAPLRPAAPLLGHRFLLSPNPYVRRCQSVSSSRRERT